MVYNLTLDSLDRGMIEELRCCNCKAISLHIINNDVQVLNPKHGCYTCTKPVCSTCVHRRYIKQDASIWLLCRTCNEAENLAPMLEE